MKMTCTFELCEMRPEFCPKILYQLVIHDEETNRVNPSEHAQSRVMMATVTSSICTLTAVSPLLHQIILRVQKTYNVPQSAEYRRRQKILLRVRILRGSRA